MRRAERWVQPQPLYEAQPTRERTKTPTTSLGGTRAIAPEGDVDQVDEEIARRSNRELRARGSA